MLSKKNILHTVRNVLSLNKGRCLDLLGSEQELYKMAYVWQDNVVNLTLLATYLVTEYAVKKDYTKDEIMAYKKGIADIMKFLENCGKEVELLSDTKNKSS
jgi:hypothetical protein